MCLGIEQAGNAGAAHFTSQLQQLILGHEKNRNHLGWSQREKGEMAKTGREGKEEGE